MNSKQELAGMEFMHYCKVEMPVSQHTRLVTGCTLRGRVESYELNSVLYKAGLCALRKIARLKTQGSETMRSKVPRIKLI